MSDTEKSAIDGKEFADLMSKFSKAMKEHKEKFTDMTQLEFPLNISGVESKFKRPATTSPSIGPRVKCGDLVRIRPVQEEFKEKTFLGMYIGELPIDLYYEIEKENNKLHVRTYNNCAFYVFALHCMIFGCESWWAKIEGDEDIEKAITDEDIDNVWYVKAIRELAKMQSSEEKE